MPAENQESTQRRATPCRQQKKSDDPLRRYLFPDNQLTERQIRAVDLLLHGLSDADVATQLGIDRTTVFRWRKLDHFARELDQQRRAVLQSSVSRLQSLLQPALNVLQKQLEGDEPRHQLRAAAILLRLAAPRRPNDVSATEDLTAEREAAVDDHMERLDAYINAPLPGKLVTQPDAGR
jgi:hypothetical protein